MKRILDNSLNELINEDELLIKLCDKFNSVYLLNISKDEIIPIKYPQGAFDNYKFPLNWRTDFRNYTMEIVDAKHANKLNIFINPFNIIKMFKDESIDTQLIFKKRNGTWEKAEIEPIISNKTDNQLALLTFKDVTERTQQNEKHEVEKDEIRGKVDHYAKLFMSASSDLYSSIYKIDIERDDVIRLEFRNDEIVEVQEKSSFTELYLKIIQVVNPLDRPNIIMKTHPSFMKNLKPGEKINFTYRSIPIDGQYNWYSCNINISRDLNKRLIATMFTKDITDETNERMNLVDISTHDKLTDLFNRHKLESMIASEYHKLDAIGVIFFDINNLKIVNDKQGHEAGDKLICLAAESIRSITNRNIHAYRIGGDEFLVVVCNPKDRGMDSIINLWSDRLQSLSKEYQIDCVMAFGKSYSKSPANINHLIEVADKNMYENKTAIKKAKALELASA